MLFFDTETDGLLDALTKIHCIRIYDGAVNSWLRFDQDHLPIEMGVKLLMDADCIVGHSAIDFDIPALTKVYPWFKPKGRVLDSLVYARLVYGDIKGADFGLYRRGQLPGNLIGRHSLEAWGYRIGALKGTFGKTTDWKTFSPEMGEYCERDVTVLLKLWEWVDARKCSKEALATELAVQHIVSRGSRFGFPFDIDGCEQLYARLVAERAAVEQEASRIFSPFYKWDSKIFKPKRDNVRLGYREGGDCCKISLVDFKVTSSQHVYVYLRRKYDWEPEEFTEKSEIPPQWRHLFRRLYQERGITGFPEPKIDDEILAKLEFPEAPLLARAALLQKRIGQVGEGSKAWLRVYNNKTKAIHGSINTIGAVTRRMTHFDPNLAQVPAVSAEYGADCRALFGCFGHRAEWTQVGADASSLEMMMLGHFLAAFDDGAFLRAILQGTKEAGTDPHSMNAGILGLTRDSAKTWFYAWLYGAGDEKLGKIAHRDKGYGRKMRVKFLASVPGFDGLLKAIQRTVKERGYLLALDGHPLPIRSDHAALNTLLQSAGALVMKKALVILDANLSYIYQPGVDYEIVANVHDEWQVLVAPTADPELIGQLAVDAITAAGQHFRLRCPLSGEYKIGKNWKETH